ncbi:alkylated DNA repair protein alkB homolog 8-like [Ctenocephalides felis]|uniref:alkylated DNA repair protein alkB homolog 8-like n=1 Tax=Ctenocephalides felis TaxID=7515 RepID=UPI000E6E4CDF|nr:alkylated DNA repair protein alkB homolog 8-like [Ctenocephalides felis]
MSIEISKSKKKKCERKRIRAQHLIENTTNITFCTTPTQNIVICNAGLVSGLTRECIVENFSKYGNIAKIVMVPGQSFCFIQFQDVSSSEKAMNEVNGLLTIGQNDGVVYLSYVNALPDSKTDDEYHMIPPRLKIIKDIVTTQEEINLLSLIDWDKNCNDEMKHRKVKHYGFEFYYDTNNVDRNKPLEEKIPEQCDIIWERLKEMKIDVPHKVDQLTVNMYKPGQGIPPHVDTHSAFESPIYSLSLGSDVVMEFRNNLNQHYSVHLPQRSLLIMDNESRYNWTHGITPRTMDVIQTTNGLSVSKRSVRTSFTFRTIRKNAICDCDYKKMCDSQQNILNDKQVTLENVAENLERIHVHSVYEQIASHFSDTRHKPWPNVEKFIQTIPVGGILIDVGCGNGKYFKSGSSIVQIGCDRSENLSSLCFSRGFQVCTCNCLTLPFRDNIADAAISIAVIHHLANEERRIQAIQQIARILKKDGVALIYVWAKNQTRQNKKSNYLKKNCDQIDDVAELKIEDNENRSK